MHSPDIPLIRLLHDRFGGELVHGALRLLVASRPMRVELVAGRLDISSEALPNRVTVKAETWLSRLIQKVGGPDLQFGIGAVDEALHVAGEHDGLLEVLEEGVPQRLAELVERCGLRLEPSRITAVTETPGEAREVLELAIDLCDPGPEHVQTLEHTIQWSSETGLRWAAWCRMRELDPVRARGLVDGVVTEVVRSRNTELIGKLMAHVAEHNDPEEITALLRAFPHIGPGWVRPVLQALLSDRALAHMIAGLDDMEHERRVAALAAIGAIAEPTLIPTIEAWVQTPEGQPYRAIVDAAIAQIEARSSDAGGQLTLVEDDTPEGRLSVAGDAGGLAITPDEGGLSEA